MKTNMNRREFFRKAGAAAAAIGGIGIVEGCGRSAQDSSYEQNGKDVPEDGSAMTYRINRGGSWSPGR